MDHIQINSEEVISSLFVTNNEEQFSLFTRIFIAEFCFIWVFTANCKQVL